METQNRSIISAGLKSLSSHLHKINRSEVNYIKLSEGSAGKLHGLKESIKSRFKTEEINAPASTKIEFIENIKSKVSQSKEIRNLGTLREKLVFSSGSPKAKIMFIGEAPGQEEELQGKPFVGPSGQLLTKIINAMGLNRDDVYISNIVKFRPKIEGGNQGAANRKPNNDEMRISLPFILEEIEAINPIVVVALGGTVMQGLLNMNETISSARGKLHEIQGAKVVVSYHPSFLLRSKTPNKDKRKVWEDMLLVMNLLGMQITEKQKNYFK